MGWVRFAGVDEIDFLRKHRTRIGSIHLKDFRKDFSVSRREKEVVALGTGVLRLPEVIKEAETMNLLDQLILDQDYSSGSMLEDTMTAVRNIRHP